MTDLRQAAQQALDAWDDPMKDLKDLCVAMDAIRAALEQQAEPVAWDKPSASFNDWWDGDYDDSENPFEQDSAAYWAWAGWKSAQRQWVGLTDEDMKDPKTHILDFIYGARWAEAKLKERNHD